MAPAAKAGELGILQALLELGADPGLKDKAGRDAWEAAREVCNEEILALLGRSPQ